MANRDKSSLVASRMSEKVFWVTVLLVSLGSLLALWWRIYNGGRNA
jgi:hypothetical protein